MGSEESIKLEVTIAGRRYPLMINANEQERIHKVVKELNNAITEFKVRYNDKDTQDHMAMTLLTTFNDLDKIRSASVENQAINKLTEIEGLLSTMLD